MKRTPHVNAADVKAFLLILDETLARGDAKFRELAVTLSAYRTLISGVFVFLPTL